MDSDKKQKDTLSSKTLNQNIMQNSEPKFNISWYQNISWHRGTYFFLYKTFTLFFNCRILFKIFFSPKVSKFLDSLHTAPSAGSKEIPVHHCWPGGCYQCSVSCPHLQHRRANEMRETQWHHLFYTNIQLFQFCKLL